MLKNIIISFSDDLWKMEQTKRFYKKIEENFEKVQSLTEGLQRENPEWDSLILTDQPETFKEAQKRNIACLPVVLHTECMDSFEGAKYLLGGIGDVDPEYLNRIYLRFHKLPWTILETERTVVREMTVEDVDGLYEIYREPSITRYTENLFEDPEMEREYTRVYINQVYRLYEFGVWIIEDKQNPGTIIGRAGLTMREGYSEPELGYVIGVSYQRNGYGREVCQAILEYGFEQFEFPRIHAITHPDNIASHKLCEKLGFHFVKKIEMNGEQMDLMDVTVDSMR